jgi:hypothetical protein
MRDFGYFCPIELSVSPFADALRVIHLVISLEYYPDYFSPPLAVPAFSANPLNNSTILSSREDKISSKS